MMNKKMILIWSTTIFLAALGTTGAFANDLGLDTDLGEKLWPGEDASIQSMANTISQLLEKRFSEGQRPAIRDAHAKGHGCVKADFKVEEKLDPALTQGVFIPGQSYKAWIRFSNGSGEINPDKGADARGMAIKLTGVEGLKILPDEALEKTQDFVMISGPVFFIDDPRKYAALLHGHDSDNKAEQLLAVTKLSPRGIVNALELGSTKIASPLEHQYWSTTPYRLGVGKDKVAIKFTARPCTPLQSTIPRKPGADFLKEEMQATLSSKDACFDFYVQTFKDFKNTPVEKSTIEWKEKSAPLIKVATVTIPKQKFDSQAQMTFCENLSFTPWHALPAHKPLGAVNRARRVIYSTISKLRHQQNNVVRKEPTGDETFSD